VYKCADIIQIKKSIILTDNIVYGEQTIPKVEQLQQLFE